VNEHANFNRHCLFNFTLESGEDIDPEELVDDFLTFYVAGKWPDHNYSDPSHLGCLDLFLRLAR